MKDLRLEWGLRKFNMEYNLTKKDFQTAFNFAVKYHLDPRKSSTTRTSGSARSLGDVLDSFLLGKLSEIGVINILQDLNTSKQCVLDFDLRPIYEVKNEPDIIGVIENNLSRGPNLFVEIKNVGQGDHWVGLTLEQFETIKKSAKNLDSVFIVGVSIKNNDPDKSLKEKDLLGSYLKEITNIKTFDKFADAYKTSIKVEYAISGAELAKNGIIFKKNDLFYNTDLFVDIGKSFKRALEAGKFKNLGIQKNGEIKKYSQNKNFPPPNIFGPIRLDGCIRIFEKQNDKSVRRFIYAETDSIVTSDVLGEFKLENGRYYFYNMNTIGRNPVLARNNIWIAKRNIAYLQSRRLIKSAGKNMKSIAENI